LSCSGKGWHGTPLLVLKMSSFLLMIKHFGIPIVVYLDKVWLLQHRMYSSNV
jgi:hypothetical protein